MGSLVLAYPMMKYLKEHYPNVELVALVFEKNQEVLELLDITERKNIFTIRDDSILHLLGDSVRAVQQIRHMKLDTTIDCELFSRFSSLLSFLSRSPTKVGFHRHTQEGLYRGNFLTTPVPYNPYLHISQQFLNLAYALETPTVPKTKHPAPAGLLKVPKRQFADKEIEEATVKLVNKFPKIRERGLVLVYPSGGALPERAWPIEYYCRFCTALIDNQLAVAVIGLASDWALGKQITDFTNSEYCFNLMGYTRTKLELLLLMGCADLLITNDGGPGQLSAIVDTPAIIFYGPESPQLYKPLSTNAYCFYELLACSPCLTAYNHRNSPCDGDNQCLKRIGVQEVLNKAMEILSTPHTEPIT